jgi:endonuclease/exonuclease/phosphatase family metal-dependent hydrolase
VASRQFRAGDLKAKLAASFFAAILLFLIFVGDSAHAANRAEIVFASYNLENYLSTDRLAEGKHEKSAPKPEKEIAALVRIIKEINPDILGVCEMGPPDQFEDFKARLKGADLGYTDFEYVQGADPERHLALLSRFPIVARQSLPDVSYELDGKPQKVRRGFLDVTVKVAPDFALRLVGAHLKSKLNDTSEGEALIRRNEAHLLRQHLDAIFAKQPNVKLAAYGDFNDTKNEPTIHEIMGPRNSAARMADLWLRDSVGDHWTHYWKTADIYSRIDFIFVSPALLPDVVQSKSAVYRSPYWNDASDHRPIFATIRSNAIGAKR